MDPNQRPAPDYSWIQNTPSPIQPEPKKKRGWLIAAVALMVVMIAAAVLVRFIFLENQSQSSSETIVSGRMSATDAGAAVLASKEFISYLSQGNYEAVNSIVSPLAALEGQFNKQTAEGYFGQDLDFASCIVTEQTSYEADTAEFSGEKYETVKVGYSCKFKDDWSATIIVNMARNINNRNEWNFSGGVTHDGDNTSDTI